MPHRRLVFQQGDHVCTLYASSEEQMEAAIQYILGGLKRGERCFYVCGEHCIPTLPHSRTSDSAVLENLFYEDPANSVHRSARKKAEVKRKVKTLLSQSPRSAHVRYVS